MIFIKRENVIPNNNSYNRSTDLFYIKAAILFLFDYFLQGIVIIFPTLYFETFISYFVVLIILYTGKKVGKRNKSKWKKRTKTKRNTNQCKSYKIFS